MRCLRRELRKRYQGIPFLAFFQNGEAPKVVGGCCSVLRKNIYLMFFLVFLDDHGFVHLVAFQNNQTRVFLVRYGAQIRL